MPAKSIFKWLHVSTSWVYRAVTWAVIGCAFLFALTIVFVRFWLLPNIQNYREPIERQLSEATRHRITIGELGGRWSGLNLQLTLGNIVVYDQANQPAITLARADSTLSWWSLVHWELKFDSIEVERPDLDVKRNAQGVISIAGIELTETASGGGLSDWLLRQEEISIRDASISWRDELRGAPELALQHVDFRLENSGRHHRFGLRAVPPAALATPLDVRGEFTGRTVTDLAQWNGRVFAQLEYADIAAWRAWLPFPVYFPHGVGAIRAWGGLKNGELAEVTADVQLSQVKTRLGKDLPELDLASLKGRVGWKLLDDGYEVSTTKLGMTTRTHTMEPVDFRLRYQPGGGTRPARGEMEATTLAVEPLMALADHLPFEAAVRKEIDLNAPRGSFHEVALKWTGTWPQPQQYSIKGRFTSLGLNPVGRRPGFTGLSGSFDGNERGGTLQLNAQHAAIEMPNVFRDKLAFETLTAQLGWARSGEQYEIRLNDISFSNRDLAASVAGVYQTVADGRGTDLNAHATRADARSLARYIPLQIGERARAWLEAAFLGGTSNDVKVRLKGNLSEFPFAEGKSGIFQVTARVSDGVLFYANGWPKVENMEGEVTFRGKRMEVVMRDSSIMGTKLTNVRAEIPDLATPERVLTVTGEAEGSTAEFLNFIAHSPVLEWIDRFTENLRTEGRGKLALKLTLPLLNPRDTKVLGSYQFLSNRIDSDDLFFPVEQASGKLEFSENGIRFPGMTMSILGGPATLTGATQRDGTMRLTAAGRINMDNFRPSSGAAIAQAIRGSTDWKSTITIRKKPADMVIESALVGIVSDLPAPLAKSAGDTMAVRLERQITGTQQDRLVIVLGNVASAQLHRRREGNHFIIERGTVSLGGAAAEPDRKGIWITGGLKSLDLDQWLLLSKSISGEGGLPQLAGVDVKFGVLDVFGRRFNDLAISGGAQGGVWQAALVGRELVGEMTWRSQGRGKVTARMKNLVIPASTPGRAPSAPDKDQPLELPALDIYADNFQIRQASLGKLEVTAVPEGRDWRLERLSIVNPDATLKVEGVWQGWLTQPRTMINFRLDVTDAGKFLQRLGQPEGLRRGTAKLEGPLSWAGNPSELDYATLSGNFLVEAHKGQFVKLDPGIGKLLGVLNLQSLPRRLSLDFRDIFSEGLAFDEIVGSVKVNRGVASTENFRIQGPAVRIQMVGDVDLARETQKLRVKVFPSMSDSLSIAGALIGGPIAGIATFVAQKLLKDPIDSIAAYEYDITGTWADPQVTKTESNRSNTVNRSQERSD